MSAEHSTDDSKVKVNFIYQSTFGPNCYYLIAPVVCDVAIVDAVAYCKLRHILNFILYNIMISYRNLTYYLYFEIQILFTNFVDNFHI